MMMIMMMRGIRLYVYLLIHDIIGEGVSTLVAFGIMSTMRGRSGAQGTVPRLLIHNTQYTNNDDLSDKPPRLLLMAASAHSFQDQHFLHFLPV